MGLALALALVAAAPGTIGSNPILAWFFDDADPPGWGSSTPYWEAMGLYNLDGSVQDLDPFHPYYACTEPLTANLSNLDLTTEIWFANNYASQNPVVIELRRGTWGNEGTVLADDTLMVTNTMPTVSSYVSDFGFIPGLVLNNESLIVKIIYLGPPGDTHIYWDDPDHPSMLRDGGTNPTEPSTWGRVKALYRN
jgi:hypothetical protein